MQAITSKVLPATENRGTKIKATAANGKSATVSYYDYDSVEEASDDAVRLVCKAMGWTGTLVRGSTQGGWVYVWVDARSELLTVTENR